MIPSSVARSISVARRSDADPGPSGQPVHVLDALELVGRDARFREDAKEQIRLPIDVGVDVIGKPGRQLLLERAVRSRRVRVGAQVVAAPSPLLWWVTRIDLLLVALGSVGLLLFLLFSDPARRSRVHGLAVLGAAFFCLQTVVLDAIVWPMFFPLGSGG